MHGHRGGHHSSPVETLALLGIAAAGSPTPIVRPATLQNVWYVNPLHGDDTRSGLTALTSIQTVAEIMRRTDGDIIQPITVYLLGDLPPSDPLLFNMRGLYDPSVAGFYTKLSLTSPLPTVTIVGQRTVVRSGRVATAANSDSTGVIGGKTAFLKDVAVVPWAAEALADQIVVLTSGASAGAVAVIYKVDPLDPSKAWMSDFFDATPPGWFNGPMPAPGPGDTYDVVRMTEVPYIILEMDGGAGNETSAANIFFDFKLFNIRGLDAQAPSSPGTSNHWYAETCIITPNSQYLIASGCKVEPRQTEIPGTVWYSLGCLITSDEIPQYPLLIAGVGGEIILNTTLFGGVSLGVYGSIVSFQQNNIGFVDCGASGGNFYAIEITGNSQLDCFPGVGLYGGMVGGENAGGGTRVGEGALVRITTGVATPNLKGVGSELQIAHVNDLLPPLEASAGGPLPALAPCTTWAQWDAAPFNRFATHYATRTSVIVTPDPF
jgi:hypothetical protein